MSFADRFSFFRRSDPTAYRFRQDSCLDHIDETLSCASSATSRKKQCYSVPSGEHNKRRATIMTTSQGSSLLEISKSRASSSNKFMSFLHKGFQKSKSSTKLEKEKCRTSTASSANDNSNLQDIIPIPIRETAIQGHSRTLFHKVPNSNLRAKQLITLTEDTKIVPIHSSILSNKFRYCVKILSVLPNVHRESEGNQYELMLPTGARSLGQTCRIVTDDENKDQCRSCHGSQLSLFSSDQAKKPMIGYIFSCVNKFEQKKWISVLTRVARPNMQNQRRKEISLNLWIQEAKNIPAKKRYFCEVYLDNCLHARTTAKMMGDMLFWGEEFNLCNLEEVNMVTFLLWKSAEESRSKKKKSQKKLICQINISTRQMDQRTSVEKWYSATSNYNSYSPESPQYLVNQGILSSANAACVPISQTAQISSLNHATSTPGSNDQVPMLRIKARYQHLDVLPLSSYGDLIKFLNENAVRTLTEIEPYLKVKAKEDLAQNLIKIIHKQGMAVPILCDLIVNEINKSDDKNLILRGNTMASKAMEIYLKLIGEKYLQLTLSDFINRVLSEHDDCEVDPQKDKFDFYGGCSSTDHSSLGVDKNTPQYSLYQRQESLMMNVDMIWAKIMSSSIYFPKDLRTVFVTLRQRIHGSKSSPYNDQPDLCDRIISACIFLRYICPAILTPSLFGLIPEYPDNPKVTRTFTLVAKCIQTLANFSNLCGTKETYMVFMNNFIESNFKTMRDFLREISGNGEPENGRKNSKPELSHTSTEGREYLYWENLGTNLPEDTIDLALCLATIHQQMEDCLQIMTPQNFSSNIKNLHNIIEAINVKLKDGDSLIMKNSSSYQHIRLQATPLHEHLNLTSFEKSDPEASISTGCPTDPRNPPVLLRSKQSKHEIPRQNSHSHSAESTPTHQLQDRSAATNEYLMTQSMMEDRPCGLQTPTASHSHSQVDTEWKAMLSASYAYNIKSREMFFSESSGDDRMNKSTDSSGYQTLSRSTDSLGKSADNGGSVPKSPSLSLKPSVKKCKQARRQTEIIARPDSSSVSTAALTKSRLKEPINTSVRLDEVRKLSAYGQCYQLDDSLDSCSTQTLTAATAPKSGTDALLEQRTKLVNSVSMPAFHSQFEYDTSQQPEFYSAFQECRSTQRSDYVPLKRASIDDTSASTGAQSAFHDPVTLRQHNQGAKSRVDKTAAINDMERIKYSLNNLRQTLNSRMKQLLLADRTTIQLELERVRLMMRICDTATINGSISVNNNLALSYDRHSLNVHKVQGNGSILANDPHCERTMSIKKYLELAENVLGEAYRGRTDQDKSTRANVLEKGMEDLLVYIFQTNQNLQNSIMSKSDRTHNHDAPSKDHIDQSILIARKDQTAFRVHRSNPNQPSMENVKSSSLGSLMTNSTHGVMVEIIDAV